MNTFKATALFLGLAMSASALGMEKENLQELTGMAVEDALRRLTPTIEKTPAEENAELQKMYAKELDFYLRTLHSSSPIIRVQETEAAPTDGKLLFKPIQ